MFPNPNTFQLFPAESQPTLQNGGTSVPQPQKRAWVSPNLRCLATSATENNAGGGGDGGFFPSQAS